MRHFLFMGRTLGLLAWLGACGAPSVDPSVTRGDGGFYTDDGGGEHLADGAPAPAVRIEYLDPDHGPFSGGTQVTLRGRGFTAGMDVSFGGRSVEPLYLKVVDDRRAVLVTPPGDPGPATVGVKSDKGEASLADAFSYEAIHVEPASGSVAGGTYVRVNGFGTKFAEGDIVTFDGWSLVDAVVVNNQQIAGYTPPGVAGAADVAVSGTAGTITAEDAFRYQNTTNVFEGGLAGGTIGGVVNITVVDAETRDGIAEAFVAVDDPVTTDLRGTTDPFGQIAFSRPVFTGPITITAAKDGYQTGSFVHFDAQDVTIFLLRIPPPVPPMPGDPPPPPPGAQVGFIEGAVQFGNFTGVGTTNWDLVPAPRTPTESKRAMVFTTDLDPFTGRIVEPGAGGIVDYIDDGRTSWEFSIFAYPSALAVVAVAGLYDSAIDPDGEDGPEPPGVFQGFAMGVARGVIVGPGDVVKNVSVIINIPLDTALHIQLDNAPRLDVPGYWGPSEYTAQAFIDLGGEGVISLPGSFVTYEYGKTSAVLPGMAPLSYSIADGSYTLIAGATSIFGLSPYSYRIVHGVTELGGPVIIDDFLGVPRPLDPKDYVTASRQHLQFKLEEGPTGTPTLFLHVLFDGNTFDRIWDMVTEHRQFDVEIPDMQAAAGLKPLPLDAYWILRAVKVPGLSINNFHYGHLYNPNYWSAYAQDSWFVSFPPRN